MVSRTSSAASRRGGNRQRNRRVAIDPGRIRAEGRRLPVGRRRDDQPVQRLEPPALGVDLAGQPVEELGMGRQAPHRAEVTRGIHDPDAKVIVPQPVGQHPGRQRILRGDQPPCQRHSPIGLGGLGRELISRGHRTQHGRARHGDRISLALEVATDEGRERARRLAKLADPPRRERGDHRKLLFDAGQLGRERGVS